MLHIAMERIKKIVLLLIQFFGSFLLMDVASPMALTHSLTHSLDSD